MRLVSESDSIVCSSGATNGVVVVVGEVWQKSSGSPQHLIVGSYSGDEGVLAPLASVPEGGSVALGGMGCQFEGWGMESRHGNLSGGGHSWILKRRRG